MAPHDTETSLTREVAESPDYRPVSRLAVAALVLGIISACALVSELLIVVPLVAIAVACAALADVGREGAKKAGRLAALGGLALATGFGVQATAAGAAARWIAAGRAASAATIFVTAVQDGRQSDAAAMCNPESREAVLKFAACAGPGRCGMVAAGEQQGTWVVRFLPSDPSACGARLVLAPMVEQKRGRTIERWFVTLCEVEEPRVRPSGT